MNMQSLANRTEELKLFKQIVTGQNPKRILLIEGESGVGKTNLLGQFAHCCSPGVSCVSIDLKSAKELGVPYILSALRKRLGRENFLQFAKQVQEFLLLSNVEVRDNVMVGQDLQIQVALNVDPETRKFRLVALQEAFFQDLRAINRSIVIILDTFNEAPPELAVWLGGGFLSEVVDTPNLRVVIAGQRVPQLTVEWMADCEYCRLEAIKDVEAWCAFAQTQKFPFPKEAVKAIILTFQGQPREIINTFAAIAEEWKA